MDQTTPGLALQAGALRDVLNYECLQSGGYGRIAGYERYDGQKAPSAATYQVVQVSSFTNVPAVGQTITQAVSGATGQIIAVNNVLGAYYMAVTLVTGTFDYTNAITTPGPVAIGNAILNTATVSALQNAQYTALAADVYRALIGAVPGSGPVLDVIKMIFASVDYVYAFRANAGNTAVNIYKNSATGWTLVPLFNTVHFTVGGTATAVDGDVLTQGGVTATVKRVMWQSGSWTGTAVGDLVVVNPTGGNFAAGAATLAGSGATVTLAGAQVPITILPGGKYEHVKCNFSGQLVTRRIYGCDGVNKAFEFDGTTYAPISTGLAPTRTDAPNHIAFHKNFLFISYGSSILYPGAGTPFKWLAVDGGGEIATGDSVNAMITLPGSQSTSTLSVFLGTNTAFLYGEDPTTFNLRVFNTGTGGMAKSAQNLFDTLVFDNLGVITLRTTLNWGNFLSTSLTKNILPFIIQERTKLTCSSVSRDKSEYRVFFSDGYGLWITVVNQQYMGASVVLFPNAVNCVDEDDDSNGNEVTVFGSNDGLGYVYKMDSGTSFDGANINAHITLAWDQLRSPEVLKRFRAASIEIQGTGYAAIKFGYQLGYGSSAIGQPADTSYTTGFSGSSNWDSGITWDAGFIWDGQTLSPTRVDVTGTAENIQVTLSSTTNYMPAFQINSIIHHYTLRRGLRG